jgi:hypothetical protein
MRRLTLIPFLAVAVSCSETAMTGPVPLRTGGAAIDQMVENDRNDVDLPLIACNGEPVPMTGESHIKLKFTTAKSGNVSAFVSADYKLSGVGEITGAQYHASLKIRDQEMASDNVSNFRHRTSLKIIGQGSVPDSHVSFTIHVVVANGETRVENIDSETRCTP